MNKKNVLISVAIIGILSCVTVAIAGDSHTLIKDLRELPTSKPPVGWVENPADFDEWR
mgnify:CR=1 FL=1